MIKNGTLTSRTHVKDGDQVEVRRLYDRFSKRIERDYKELHELPAAKQCASHSTRRQASHNENGAAHMEINVSYKNLQYVNF